MTRNLNVATLQLPLAGSEAENIEAVSELIAQSAITGAQIILPPELFSGPYFCKTENEAHFALARPAAEHPSVKAMAKLAKQLGVAIPTSFFERDGPHHYNSLAMIGPSGDIISVPAIRGLKSGKYSAQKSASASAGINGILNAPARWP
jgi:N-carbamoylputrescine amidase